MQDDDDDDDDEGDEDEDEDEDDDDVGSAEDDGAEATGAARGKAKRHDQLLAAVHQAIGTPNSATAAPRKRAAAAEAVMGSAENESEFSTSLPGAAAAEQLDAAALLAHVSQSDKTLQKVKRKVVSLSGQKGGVEPPLSGPAAARVARSEAFSHTSKDVTKWQPIVKKNREAENLKFPLNDPGQQKLSNAALVENFAPSGSMEDEIRSMLKQGGATEDSIRRYEELELNKLSVEDVKERRNQLNKLRNLMFYQATPRRHPLTPLTPLTSSHPHTLPSLSHTHSHSTLEPSALSPRPSAFSPQPCTLHFKP